MLSISQPIDIRIRFFFEISENNRYWISIRVKLQVRSIIIRYLLPLYALVNSSGRFYRWCILIWGITFLYFCIWDSEIWYEVFPSRQWSSSSSWIMIGPLWYNIFMTRSLFVLLVMQHYFEITAYGANASLIIMTFFNAISKCKSFNWSYI